MSKRRLMKIGWVFLLLLPAPTAVADSLFEKGLLFRIESRTGVASYLFGTMHSEDPRVTALPVPVREAFDASERLALEVDMDPLSLLSAMGAMMLDEGQDLPSVIGADLYARCLDAAKTAGLPEQVLMRYKPWAVAVLLSMPPVKTGQFLDLLLYQSATAGGKPVIGLETVDEQLRAFDRLSLEDQLALLEDAISNLQELPVLLETLTETYLKRDLSGLAALSVDNFRGAPEVMQRFKSSAIDDRNSRMAARLAEQIDRGGVFAAVGALHLPGERGLLNLLSQRGYLVERLY